MSRAELQELCKARGVDFRRSWTKAQLRDALAASAPVASGDRSEGRKPRLSRSAREIVSQLERV